MNGRKSSNAARLRKGDRFMLDGIEFEVTGFPQSFAAGRHQVPLRKVGNPQSRSSRRTFDSEKRFSLV